MTDKTKMSNLESYQELTIQLSTVNLKLDAILKLLNKPEITIEDINIKVEGGLPGPGASWVGVIDSETFDREFKQ